MKRTTLTCIAVAAILAMAGPVSAAGDKETQTGKDKEQLGAAMDTGSQQQELGTMGRSADELRGLEVFSQDGEELGEIEEIAMDETTGKLRFVILSQGGIMGIGDEEIPVAAEALRFEQDLAILTVDKSKLDNAPEQMNMTDDQFQRDLQTHYGVSPAWEEGQQEEQQKKAMDEQTMDQGSEMEMEAAEQDAAADTEKKEY